MGRLPVRAKLQISSISPSPQPSPSRERELSESTDQQSCVVSIQIVCLQGGRPHSSYVETVAVSVSSSAATSFVSCTTSAGGVLGIVMSISVYWSGSDSTCMVPPC